MTLTSHAIVGAAVASFLPAHPGIVFCLAFASHFVLDAIPHWDYPIHSPVVHPKKGAPWRFDSALALDMLGIGADASLGILLALALFATPATIGIVLLGACAAILPDPLQFAHTRLRREPLASLQRFHEWIHTRISLNGQPVLGIASQVVLLALVVVAVRMAR